MLNTDFSKRVVIDTNSLQWRASPMAGVWRKPLAREEAERGHATSIVRYEAGASFREHDHPGGEEILVLEGTFSDHSGDFGAGTYFRNPIGFKHAPFSEEGCVLLVKLHQMMDSDTAHVVADTDKADFEALEGGIEILQLHQHGSERVAMVRWPANAPLEAHVHEGGEEVYVLSGELHDENGVYPVGSWLRLPDGSEHAPFVQEETLLWVKSGHL
jgi:anti-sigma factor ChrR (cupin superfamily)